MAYEAQIQSAKEQFGKVLEERLELVLVMTDRGNGANGMDCGEYLMQTVKAPDLEQNEIDTSRRAN